MKALLAILMVLVVVMLAIALWVNVADAAPVASHAVAVSNFGPLQILSHA